MNKLLCVFLLALSIIFTANAADIVDVPASEEAVDDTIQLPIEEQKPIAKPEKKKAKLEKIEAAKPVDGLPQELPQTPKEPPPVESNLVVVQGLNKVMGRSLELEIPLGTVSRFENLEIIAHKCKKTLSDTLPENSALLEIREVKAGEEPKQLFLGWMFSSSPSISALEHPVYDITVLSCENRANLE